MSPGRGSKGRPAASNPIMVGLISADYARTMGIPLRSGRAFSVQDVMRADRVALINQTAAKQWEEGENPIG